MDNVGCSGWESSLAYCNHNGWGKHNCDHNLDVSIECAVPTTTALANGKCTSIIQDTELDC